MKNLILACFCIFSFEEAFSQTGYKDADKDLELRRYNKDKVSTGQSANERRVKPPGSMRQIRKEDSIDGVNCTDNTGNTYAPNSAGYKKCVDKANRIQ